MRHLAIILALLWAPCAVAQDSGLVTLETRDASKGWEGVGRLDIQGKGFCTAALIQPRLILTAAHCLYDDTGALIAPDRFTFEAGLRDGRAAASRRITRMLAHPDYDHRGTNTDASEVASDIGLLELDQPIRNGRIMPYPIAAKPFIGDQIGIVSYARERANAASLQKVCSVIGRQDGVILMSCDIAFGASGAPVFIMQNDQARIVSVVSAMAEIDGNKIAIGTSLAQPLAQLLTDFASQSTGGARKIITNGQRSEGGAKFVRP